MADKTNKRRYRINPVEVGIFLVICGVFIHSAYRLVFEWNDVKERASLASHQARTIASVTQTVSVPCAHEEATTQASVESAIRQVALTGELCHPMSQKVKESAEKIEVVREQDAKIFAGKVNAQTGMFESEPISLRVGKNDFEVRTKFKSATRVQKISMTYFGK